MLATNFWKKALGKRLCLNLTATSEKGLEVSSPGTEMLLQAAAYKEGVPLPGIPSPCNALQVLSSSLLWLIKS